MQVSESGSHLEGVQLVSLLLEAADNFTDEAALDAVRLDHDVGLLHGTAERRRGVTCEGGSSGTNGWHAHEVVVVIWWL